LESSRFAAVIISAQLESKSALPQVYVRNKERACAESGVTSFKHELPETVTQEEVSYQWGAGCAYFVGIDHHDS
jgi:5,10-methylene-tetrahydrofolate dehydrogenase/methenyl tetrahydrofolate cyclohydrolase